MGGAVKDIASKAELDNLRQSDAPVALHFWASWCDASKQMDEVFSHLATDFPRAHFLRVEAEEHPEISEAYSVAAVPYFVFFKDGKTVDTLEGADPSSLANKVAKIVGSISSVEPAAPASLGLAAGPTILETVKENAKSTIEDRTQPISSPNTLKNRLEKLTNSHPVMLFMKGTPEEPRCGFSKKVVNILKEEKVDFGSFDILSDNEVREGLKKFSNWPTFPQLYCKGELLGGADIAIAMHESGELKEAFKDQGITTIGSKESGGVSSGETLEARLKALVNSNPVMLFMKGSADEPKCGFSSKVVKALKEEKVSFGTFDILSDEEVRQGLKKFSNWPTFPQLYYKGELIGGCDIVLELSDSGDLKATLSE